MRGESIREENVLATGAAFARGPVQGDAGPESAMAVPKTGSAGNAGGTK